MSADTAALHSNGIDAQAASIATQPDETRARHRRGTGTSVWKSLSVSRTWPVRPMRSAPQHTRSHVFSSKRRLAYPSSLPCRRMLHCGNTETGLIAATGVSRNQPCTYLKGHEDHSGRVSYRDVSENSYSCPESPKWRARADRRERLSVRTTYGPPRLQALSRPGLISLRQRIRSQGTALAKMEIRTSRSS